MHITEGSRVLCTQGDIDKSQNEGRTGVVSGFARFSSYHPREALVRFDDGTSGWFWLSTLEIAQCQPSA